MRLPFFRAKDTAAEPAGPRRAAAASVADEGPLQAARTQARRRLVGALVLLAAGVIGFPLLFETQPRPLPVDLPILVAEGASPRGASASRSRPLPELPPDAGNETGAPLADLAASQGARVVAPSVSSGIPSAAPSAPTLRVVPSAPVPVPSTVASVPPALPAASAPVQASSSAAKPAKAPSAPDAAVGRFVVQVGAYNDTERLKAARQKLDKLGYKSYTQDVETPSGKRTRVRVGPFASRQEAEAVAGKVKASGMQANILSL